MIRRHKNILISIVSSLCMVVFLCLPTVTVAASDEESHFLSTITLEGGGPAVANSPLDGSPADPEGNFRTCDGPSCDYCDLVEMIEKIIRWLVLVLSTIGVLLFVYAGFMLSSSQGDVGKRKKAKDMILSVVIGLIILLSSWMIIDVIMKAFVGGEVGVWNSVTENCGQHNKVGTVSKDPIIAEAESFTTPEFSRGEVYAVEGAEGVIGGGVSGAYSRESANSVPESSMVSLRSAGINVASWQGIDGSGRTDLVHPAVMSRVVWMQEEGLRRFGTTPFQVTAAYTRGVGHSANSKHYDGIAVDFQPVNNQVRMSDLEQLAQDAGFTFVLNEGSHIHADSR